jgi:hypothetical protein
LPLLNQARTAVFEIWPVLIAVLLLTLPIVGGRIMAVVMVAISSTLFGSGVSAFLWNWSGAGRTFPEKGLQLLTIDVVVHSAKAEKEVVL